MATSVNISSYSGSVVGSDWSPAILAAMNDIKTTGGTIVIDQNITVQSAINYGTVGFTTYVPVNIVGNGGAVITVDAAGILLFYPASNASSVLFRDLTFIGNTTASVGAGYYTCTGLLYNTGQTPMVIDNCTFAGIAASTAGVIDADAVGGTSPIIIRNSRLGGNGGYGGIVNSAGADTLFMENVDMLDYQNYAGNYYNKAGYASYWVKAVYSGTPTNSYVPMVYLKNVRSDEGADFCYIEGYPRVVIDQCASNRGNTQGIYLKDVANALINQYWFGYNPGSNAIKVENCGHVKIDGLQIKAGETHDIVIDAATDYVEIVNSPGVTVSAAVGATYSLNGVSYKGTVAQVG